MEELNQELDEWTYGDIVVDRVIESLGCRFRVVNEDNRWSLLRGFMLGSRPVVSVDVSEQTEADVMRKLMDFF